MLIQLAESGIFNQTGLTPLKAAERANLWEAWMYLNVKAAQNELTNEIINSK